MADPSKEKKNINSKKWTTAKTINYISLLIVPLFTIKNIKKQQCKGISNKFKQHFSCEGRGIDKMFIQDNYMKYMDATAFTDTTFIISAHNKLQFLKLFKK